MENEYQSSWGEAYFAFEIALLGDKLKSSTLAYWQISTQRAAATISELTAWNVIARQLNKDLDSERRHSFEKISQQVGYTDIFARVASTFKVVVTCHLCAHLWC